MDSILFNKRGEFRLLFLYIPAVLVQGILANVNLPIVDVYWDVVFYKNMAFGFADLLDFKLKNHIPVPPLYPFVLSFGCYAPDYRIIELIHSWLNPALYFMGLFPIYWLARYMLDVKSSAAVCVLYILYPAVIYTQWTVSENLAIPLTVFAVFYAVKLLIKDHPENKESVILGIFLAALVLTRVQALVIASVILIWLVYRFWWKGKNFRPCIISFCVSLGVVIIVWFGLGYINLKGTGIFYSEVNYEKVSGFYSILFHFLNRFMTHWTALWLEGAFLITVFPFVLLLGMLFFRKTMPDQHREMVYLILVISAAVVGSIAAYRVLRTNVEIWSVSLRHVCYVNLLCLPLCVKTMGATKRKSISRFLSSWGIFLSVIVVFILGFFFPSAWDGFTHNNRFFSNSPSLDFFRQWSALGPWLGSLLLFCFSAVLGAMALVRRGFGILFLAVLLLFNQWHEYDFMWKDQRYAIKKMGIEGIHDFCEQLRAGRWKQYPIYCQENYRVNYLVPNLLYWVNWGTKALPEDAPRPEKPYLYLTFSEEQKGELVFKSRELRAYLYEE